MLASWLILLIVVNAELATVDLQPQGDVYVAHVQIAGKTAKMIVDTTSTSLTVLCSANANIFKRAYRFLKDPFYQTYSRSCQQNQQIELPEVGKVPVRLDFDQNLTSSWGRLGLSDHGQLLNNLPSNFKSFSIFINSLQFGRPSRIDFGGYDLGSLKSRLVDVPLSSSTPWTANLKYLQLDGMQFYTSNAIINSSQPYIRIPGSAYHSLSQHMKRQHGCQTIKTNIKCLCLSGNLTKFSMLTLSFFSSSFNLSPQSYIKQQSGYCQVLIRPNENSFDTVLGLPFFRDNIVLFEPSRVSIAQADEITPVKQSNKSPIHAFLYGLVLFIISIFISLVLIEMFRRITGLSSCRQETIHEVILRRQI